MKSVNYSAYIGLDVHKDTIAARTLLPLRLQTQKEERRIRTGTIKNIDQQVVVLSIFSAYITITHELTDGFIGY